MVAKKVVDMSEQEEIIDEKKIMKEAEEREKERKAEEKIAKVEAKAEEREQKKEEKAEKVKQKKQIRVKPRHGKKYRELEKLIEKEKEYPINEALELALKTSPAKFDATVEAHIKLGARDKNVRGMVKFTGGLVKVKKFLEVTESNVEDVIEKVKAGKIDFDIMIADLKLMPKLAPLAKVLGPKGLMPSPKAGTAVEDTAKALAELQSGKVEYRADKFNIVHMPIGKISFGFEKIKENLDALMAVLPIKKAASIYITTSMGPSIKVAKK